MRVLLLNTFDLNGQTTHAFSLGRELGRQGLRVCLLMPDFMEEFREKYRGYLDYLGYEIMVSSNPLEIGKMMARYGFTIIHAHSPLTYRTAQKLSEDYDLPYVLSCHGLGVEGERYTKSLEEAARIICISRRVAESLSRHGKKITVIPNGVDSCEYAPGKKSPPVKILYAGRIDSYKRRGFLALERSLKLCRESSLSFEYYCAANVRSSFPGAISLGWVPSIAPYANNTDIIVGTGRAVLEGMAAGNAAFILGRRWGGVMTPEKAGWGEGADVSGLRGKDPCHRNIFLNLGNLLRDTPYLRELQAFSRSYAVENYNIKTLTQNIVRVYEKALTSS